MQSIKLHYYTADILFPIQISFLFSHVSVRAFFDVELRRLGEGVLILVEDLQINCGDEESECCVLCDRDYREYYAWP
jgi:hypothetical protein